jgi:hypothetical protein
MRRNFPTNRDGVSLVAQPENGQQHHLFEFAERQRHFTYKVV